MSTRARFAGIGAFLLWTAAGAVSVEAQETWGYLWHAASLGLHTLQGESVRLGRLPESDVVVSDPRVSRRHAEVRNGPEGVEIVDLRSTNGTYLNGRKLVPGRPYPLRPGDFLVLAVEGFLYHEDKTALWNETLDHTLLARFVRLRVPVLKDRISRALGKERTIASTTEILADLEAGEVELGQTSEGPPGGAFQPGEAVFVAGAVITEGSLRLSLWGLDREGEMVSRRATFSQMDHGELVISLRDGPSGDGGERFESRWQDEGVLFLAPLFSLALERFPSESSQDLRVLIARNLIDRGDPVALRDAAKVLEYLHRTRPEEAELPLMVARAHAEHVAKLARERRLVLDEKEWAELENALERCREWARKARDLGADEDEVASLEADIARAQALMERAP